MKCAICGREGADRLCEYHAGAKEKVEKAFPFWVKAYGRLEWKEYLAMVNRNVQTGRWAKEITEYLAGV
jgi:hypothetical protein